MSRSFQHTPIFGHTGARSEKWDKSNQHRVWRRQLREALSHDDWERASYDVPQCAYGWAKDGRQYITRPRREWMRK